MSLQMLRLRDYQEECSKALDLSHAKGVRRPAVVLPTGAGKTVVFSHRALTFTLAYPDLRVLVLAHTEELVDQAYKKIRGIAPHLRVGIVKAGRNETQAQVIVASVQTLRSPKRRAQLRRIGLIIVDECHHATAPTYLDILEHYGAIGPACEKCAKEETAAKRTACAERGPAPENGALSEGFTATLARSDKSKLAMVWEEVAFKRDIAFMIRRKYLLDVRGRLVKVPDFTTKGLKTQGGDFKSEELADRLTDSMAPEVVAKAYVEHASDRSGLVFTPNVASAYVFAEAFVTEGITAEVVHGALPAEERRLIIKRLETGETQVLVNCMVLTEGFDSPIVSCVVIARPTKSSPLYQQMVGRALRLHEGQAEALVLDVVGVSRQHGLASLVDLSSREDVDQDKLDEGMSLIELEDFEDLEEEVFGEGGAGEGVEYYTGPVEVIDFDPLSRDSMRAWKTTASGVHYVPMGVTKRDTGSQGLYYFLVHAWDADAEPDTWSVVWCTQDGRTPNEALVKAGFPKDRPVGATPHQGLPLSQAMVWAEQEVEDLAIRQGLDPTETFSSKKASWRSRRGPSEPQARMCRNLGIELPDEPIKQGEVSDMIDNVMAAQQIDRWVEFLAQQGK